MHPQLYSTSYASLMSAASASSSGGSALTIDFDGSAIIQFVIFLLVFIVLKPVLFDPFMRVLEAREKKTIGAKADAREMDEKAGEIIKRYDGELEKVRKVANEERERFRYEAQKLEAQILGEARAEASRVTSEGKDKIRKEAELVRVELDKVSSQLAREAATKVLGREVA